MNVYRIQATGWEGVFCVTATTEQEAMDFLRHETWIDHAVMTVLGSRPL